MNRFQAALARVPQNVPPVWLMRQAGRYHRHYQGLRAEHSFMELCKNPELAAQVALGPIRDFDFDVAILFSDLLFPLEAIGMGLEYGDKGPALGFQLSPATFPRLRGFAEAMPQLAFQRQAVAATRAVLPKEKSLVGFVGGPWTLFVYAVEGGHAGNLLRAKNQPELWASFRDMLLPILRENIRQQLEGGAETVMVFDTAAGELAPRQFQEWVEGSLLSLAGAFPGQLGYYSKGTQPAFFRPAFRAAPWAGQGFDHRYDLPAELAQPRPGFVQGNFDQALLHAEPAHFPALVKEYLRPFRELGPAGRAGWVAGLGHGVLPATPEANVRAYVQLVREELA